MRVRLVVTAMLVGLSLGLASSPAFATDTTPKVNPGYGCKPPRQLCAAPF